MADTLTTITNLINSPPGVLVAGGVLAGIVWKFFERVEGVLTDQTKFETAVWLVGVEVAPKWQSVVGAYVTAACGPSCRINSTRRFFARAASLELSPRGRESP